MTGVQWQRRGLGVVAGRRSRRRVAAGVALAVVCAGLAWVVAAKASGRVAVLVTARPVAAGARLGAADVRVVRLAGAEPLGVIGERDRAVGRRVALPLPAGALLTDRILGPPDWPPAGHAVVTVTPKNGRLPAVRAGDHVGVVVLDDDRGDTGPGRGSDTDDPSQLEATVVDVTGRDGITAGPSDGPAVSLLVAATDAPGLAEAAADDRVALIVLAPR